VKALMIQAALRLQNLLQDAPKGATKEHTRARAARLAAPVWNGCWDSRPAALLKRRHGNCQKLVPAWEGPLS